MKTHHNQNKPQQKPIKYKQFIQQLQNSSRSSLQDQSLLSQRSFRQSQTPRDFQDQFRHQTTNKTSQKQSPFKIHEDTSYKHKINQNTSQKENTSCKQTSSYKISNPSYKNQQKQSNDKLYTFCDSKLTQRSIQIVNHSNSKSQTQHSVSHRQKQNPKYFKTNKQRNEQKENMDFVNQILHKIQSGGFEGKVLKTQNSQLQNLQKSTAKSPQPILTMKKQISDASAMAESGRNTISQSNSHRKIQSVKKIFVLARQSSNKVSNKKINNVNNISEEKSRENSVRKDQQKTQIEKQSQQKCSSKKKIVSLNINPLKNSLNAPNYPRLKLSLDKSSDKHNQQKQKSFCIQTRPHFNLSSRSSLVQARMLSSSMQKIPSLDHSKIQNLNDGSRTNLLMSGAQLSELAILLPKQPAPNQQVQRLRKIVDENKERQKKLGRQIYELNQKLKHYGKTQDKRQVQILQKDCLRLTNSYKEIKKIYEITLKQKEDLEGHMQSLIGENNDLKECLDFKSHELNQLNQKVLEMSQQIEHLENQLQNRAFPSQLEGLSEMIRQKLSQYEGEISSLLDQNNKLTLLRQKLQNYNQTLKDEIHEKDSLIDSLQRHLKDMSSLRRSCKDEIGDYRQNETRLNKLCKELDSKLKLSNIHNEYLTKEIVSLKQERKQMISSGTGSANSSHVVAGGSPSHKHKLGSLSTLSHTITTRNSSISHPKDHSDHFLHHFNKEKHFDQQNYSSSEQLQ